MATDAHDGELARDFALNGAEAAFQSLVSRHLGLVYATALRQVGDHGLAQDVTQHVFLDLARKASRLAGFQTLAGWLHRATLLEARAQIRSQLRRKQREETAGELLVSEAQPDSLGEALQPLLDEALMELREPERLALVLRYFEDRPLREVGTAMGIAEEAARKRVDRALEKVAAFFRSKGFAIPTGAAGVAAMMTSSANAAPPSLIGGIVAAAKSVAPMAGGFQLLILKATTMTKLQTTVVCLLLAAGAVGWNQRQTEAAKTSLQTELAGLEQDRGALAELTEKENQARRELVSANASRLNAEVRLTKASSNISAAKPKQLAGVYRWNETADRVRVSKDIVKSSKHPAVRGYSGKLTDEMRQALQLTSDEEGRLQKTMTDLLDTYNNLLNAGKQVVQPKPNDLYGNRPEDVRVVEFPSTAKEFEGIRAGFFSSIEGLLGPDRAEIFKSGLTGWMPVNDEDHSFGSGNGIFIRDMHVVVARGDQYGPGKIWMKVEFPSHGSFSTSMNLDDVPSFLSEQVRDWVESAKRERELKQSTPGIATQDDLFTPKP